MTTQRVYSLIMTSREIVSGTTASPRSRTGRRLSNHTLYFSPRSQLSRTTTQEGVLSVLVGLDKVKQAVGLPAAMHPGEAAAAAGLGIPVAVAVELAVDAYGESQSVSVSKEGGSRHVKTHIPDEG